MPDGPDTSVASPTTAEGTISPRVLQPGQRCEVWIASAATGARDLVYTTDQLLLEAPNWTPDNAALILNGAGALWRLDLGTGSLGKVPAGCDTLYTEDNHTGTIVAGRLRLINPFSSM